MAHADKTLVIKHARRIAAHNIASGEKAMAEFSKRLAENPASAMSWADSAFEAAAKVQVFRQVADLVAENAQMTDEELVERLTKAIKNEVMRGARFPSRSTSTSSNMMATCLLAAWADAGELVDL